MGGEALGCVKAQGLQCRGIFGPGGGSGWVNTLIEVGEGVSDRCLGAVCGKSEKGITFEMEVKISNKKKREIVPWFNAQKCLRIEE